MSGGSFNYLYSHAGGLEDQRGDIEEMARLLVTVEGGERAARATRDVLRLLDGAERIAQSLSDVWLAAEWWQSCDYSEDQVREALAGFKPYPPDGEPAEA